MAKKNIYMVQVDHLYGNAEKSIYLPYAVGLLTAYAFTDAHIREHYAFKGFVYWRKPVETAVEELTNPFVVGFSCYVWNTEYNKAFAKS